MTSLNQSRSAQDLFALAAIRQPGEPVDERLPLDDAMQPSVVEGHDRVRGERYDGHPVLVVRGPESLAEPRDHVAQPPSLGRELVDPRLKLESHLVEGPPEQGELVAPLHRNALLQVAPGDRASRVDEAADRAHDCAAFDVSDTGDEQERGDQSDQQPVRRRPVRGVDTGLRADDAKGRRRLLVKRVRHEGAVLLARDRDGARLPGEQGEAPASPGRADLDPPSFDEHDVVVALEARTRLEAPDERAAQRHRGDHCPPGAGRTEDGDLPRGGHPVALPNVKSAGDLNAQMRPPLEHACQCRSIPPDERALEGRVAGELGGGGVR